LILINIPAPGGAQTGAMLDLQPRQQAANLGNLRKLARSLEISEEIAVAIYEREVARLKDGARVERFLSIFAERNAKKILEKEAGTFATTAAVITSLTERPAAAPQAPRELMSA